MSEIPLEIKLWWGLSCGLAHLDQVSHVLRCLRSDSVSSKHRLDADRIAEIHHLKRPPAGNDGADTTPLSA